MALPNIVLDTNVIVSALRSKLGASHKLFRLVGAGKFTVCLSVPLFIEYQRALFQPRIGIPFSAEEIHEILSYICANSHQQDVYFLWRPSLPDPNDDMVLELAVASGAQYIVTFNRRDFRGAERFGVKVKTPGEFLQHIGEIE